MIIIGFILGTVLGSFVKALADRSLSNKSFQGRSYCPKCKHTLAWYDLLPVISYLLLQGKCRYCRKKIGIEYVAVEVVMGVLVGFLFWQTPFAIAGSEATWQLASKIFFIIILAVLFLTDLKKMFIPDRVILPSIVIGVTASLIITVSKIAYLYYYLSLSPIGRKLLPPFSDYFLRHALLTAEPFIWSILTALGIGGFFLGLIILTKGKGMGGGDVKLGAFMGIMLGFPQALFALFLAFFSGALFSIALILSGKKHFGQTIPFGPFLVLGSLVMLFWGKRIIDWYLYLSF